MKTLATLVLSLVLAQPVVAGVVHDEVANGDISTDPNNPTPVTFTLGSNQIINGSCGVGDVRDYITFTIPAGQKLVHLYLTAFSPDNLAFASFNAGTVSFIPNATTNPMFLSGIHAQGSDATTDILPRFVDRPVTQNGLSASELDPGDYCFLIQQTSPITTTYALDFVVDDGTPTRAATWGKIRSLYR